MDKHARGGSGTRHGRHACSCRILVGEKSPLHRAMNVMLSSPNRYSNLHTHGHASKATRCLSPSLRKRTCQLTASLALECLKWETANDKTTGAAPVAAKQHGEELCAVHEVHIQGLLPVLVVALSELRI